MDVSAIKWLLRASQHVPDMDVQNVEEQKRISLILHAQMIEEPSRRVNSFSKEQSFAALIYKFQQI